MKYLFTLMLAFCVSAASSAQTSPSKSNGSKQYRSAKTGRYVSKSTAKKNPSTTYSTTKKSK